MNARSQFCLSLSAIALLLSVAQPTQAVLLSASTADSGGLTNLTGVTTTERGFVDQSQFVGVDVIHWVSSQTNANAANIGAADPGFGNRATLMEDFALNTGLINPGDQGALTPSQQAQVGPSATGINGLGVQFVGGLVNGPGIDVVVAEIDDGAGGDLGDAFIVSRLDGVAGSISILDNSYTTFGSIQQTSLVDTTATSLDFFENFSGWTANNPNSAGWVAVGFDLSDLGYDDFDVVQSLFISNPTGTSNNIDLTLVTGLFTPPVPEPSSATLLALGCVGAALNRRRRRSRKAARYTAATA